MSSCHVSMHNSVIRFMIGQLVSDISGTTVKWLYFLVAQHSVLPESKWFFGKKKKKKMLIFRLCSFSGISKTEQSQKPIFLPGSLERQGYPWGHTGVYQIMLILFLLFIIIFKHLNIFLYPVAFSLINFPLAMQLFHQKSILFTILGDTKFFCSILLSVAS